MTARSLTPTGIIDIGSNSVRFVAYGGSPRIPSILFNEKITAGLGRGIARDGALDPDAMELTLEGLNRFYLLSREMKIKRMQTVATAAVRDAANGPEFLKRVAAIGLKPKLLSGAEEAVLSGLGVISAIPRANGVVADLGGGSLELIGIARGAAGAGVSLPLGVLRLKDKATVKAVQSEIDEGLEDKLLRRAAEGHGLYLVGGSFRALATIDLKMSDHPLPIVHQHHLTEERLDFVERMLVETPAEQIKAKTGLSSGRIANVTPALVILRALLKLLKPRSVVVSSFGLREGLLYRDLDDDVRKQDPLLAAAFDVGERLGRFGDHGAELDQWMNPLFPQESSELQRLRLATCLLGDIAWNAHPDFRAERAVDMAVHGNWVGIDGHGRAMIGRALCSAFGGEGGFSPDLARLLGEGEMKRAETWGRALRLAQRLSGGTEGLLRRSSIALRPRKLVLTIARRHRPLYAEAVRRRFEQLAKGMEREGEVVFD